MNKITVHGNLTANPELRIARSGVPVTTFTVAANRRRLNRSSGQWVDQPAVFHRVVCFNKLAEHVAASLTRGATVAVTGEFADDSFTPEGGSIVRRIKLEATDVAASLRYATVTITKTRTATSNDPAAGSASDGTPDASTVDAEGAEREETRPALTVVGSD